MKSIVLILFLFFAAKIQADMGPATIQAVCKITTQDKKDYFGFIVLMRGFDGIHPNGFYLYEDDHYNWSVFYNYEFNDLKRNEVNRYAFGNFQPFAKKIWFLDYTINSEKYWLINNINIKTDSTGKYLFDHTEIERKYLMLDTLPLFLELPTYMYIDYRDTISKSLKIPMMSIISIELVKQPPSNLLDEIEKKRKACSSLLDTPDSDGDYMEPIWFHEMGQDSISREIFKQYFTFHYRH